MNVTDISSYYYDYQVQDNVSYQIADQSKPIIAMPHLILYFDVNKTVIGFDKQGKKTAHDAINSAIAEKIFDYWDESLESPISYHDYVKYHLLPNPENSEDIKLQQKVKICGFLEFLKQSNHPEFLRTKAVYDQAIQCLESRDSQVFPSFYKLIHFLKEKQIPHTIVLRTFGSEAPEVVQEINQKFGSSVFTDFRSMKEGHLQDSDEDLYKFIINNKQNRVIQDDWKWWFKHHEDWKYGKPFPIDMSDSSRISLFFDDNAVFDPLHPDHNNVAPFDVTTGKPIHPQEMIEKKRLFPVDFLEALCNEDYYIQLIGKALQ